MRLAHLETGVGRQGRSQAWQPIANAASAPSRSLKPFDSNCQHLDPSTREPYFPESLSSMKGCSASKWQSRSTGNSQPLWIVKCYLDLLYKYASSLIPWGSWLWGMWFALYPRASPQSSDPGILWSGWLHKAYFVVCLPFFCDSSIKVVCTSQINHHWFRMFLGKLKPKM